MVIEYAPPPLFFAGIIRHKKKRKLMGAPAWMNNLYYSSIAAILANFFQKLYLCNEKIYELKSTA